MESDSRSRIDQFFASKKQKSALPSLKSQRTEKGERAASGGSPGAKGTLDSYLKSSQDDASVPRRSSLAEQLPHGQDLVRRKLGLDIEPMSKTETKPSVLSSERIQSNGLEAAQKGALFKTAIDEGPSKECPLSANGATENPEVRQFANDFLSLYCSDLQSNKPTEVKSQNHKRHGSPSLVEKETKKSTKRHQMTFPLDTSDATTSSGGKNVEQMLSNSETREFGYIVREETIGNDPVEIPPSLKDLDKATVSTLVNASCSTPVSLAVKSSTDKTPKSACGSSMFSPGEGFWSEAIKLADGLCAPANSSVCHAANESLSHLRKTGQDEKEEMLHDGKNIIHFAEMGKLASVDKYSKDLDKKGSPLPVKHFDFSCEEKSSDVVAGHYGNSDGSKSIISRYNKGSDCDLVGRRGLRTTNAFTRCSNAQKIEEVHVKQEMALVIPTTERKLDLSSENDSIGTESPANIPRSVGGNRENNEACTPASFLQSKDWLDLSSWLPSEICSIYRKKGIQRLYQWQVDCLQVEGVLQKKNLVYCASTSAGKSFVAEILMLRRVLSTGKMAILVLPYVSICTEKAEHLEVLLEPLGKHVRGYYGNQGGGTLPKDTSVAVCTIEKANSLINRLLEEGRLSEIGIIVIDELHMVGDQHRGYLLELMLTKLCYAAGEGNSETSSGECSGSSSGKGDTTRGLQIVGMSATMPNVAAVAEWLQAALYQTEFRPVPLEEYIKVGNTIYNKSMDIIRTISKGTDLGGKDPDHIVELCNEVVQEGHSVLIFCSSRKGCESTARHISKFLKKFSVNPQNDDNEFSSIISALDALRRSPAGLDPILEETLPSGVAYHHAGLTVEEREVVETCYRKGLVRVLTATSTLAAGVNLPARRVIFRQPRIGRDFIDGTRYKQMAGRAGRTGIDSKGESILICRPEEIKRIVGLLNESCPPLNSCLSEDKNGMTHAILEVVAGGIVQTANDIHRYVRKFLEWNEDTKLYSTSPLGRAAFGSSLSPDESLIVLEDLSRAREGFVLASDLHLVYLVTPTNVEIEPDWELYYQRFMELSSLDQSVGNRIGVAEPFLMRMAHGAPIQTADRFRGNTRGGHSKLQRHSGITRNNMLPDDQALRVCKRFYVALILARLVQEVPVTEVCEAFKVARGMVQALQENAGRFASMVSLFCERLGWHDLEGLVGKFQNRVSFGGSRARALYKAGLRTPLAITEASIAEIVKALFESSSWAAEETSAQRRMQLGIAKKIKNGARKIVLDKAEEARLAAFSAFQSLGLDVTQFPRSMLSTLNGNHAQEGVMGTAGNISAANSLENVSARLSIEESKESDKTANQEVSRKVSTVAFVYSAPVDSSSILPEAVSVQKTSVQAELPAPVSFEKGANMIPAVLLERSDDENKMVSGNSDQGVQVQVNRENAHSSFKDWTPDKSPISAVNYPGGLESFLDLWDTVEEFYFDIHYSKRTGMNSCGPFELHGFAICWENSPVYYVNIPRDLFCKRKSNDVSRTTSVGANGSWRPEHSSDLVNARWRRIGEIMGKVGVRKFTWNLKVQIQVLGNCAISIQKIGVTSNAGKDMGLQLVDSSYLLLPPVNVKQGIDMCIVAWILWPDEERSSNPNLEKEVKKRLSSDAAAAAHRCGRWKNQMRKAAHDGCCRRVAQTRALSSVLWKLLFHEQLSEALMKIELPLVNVVADMELWGIGVDMEGCLWARNVLGKKLRQLEKEAYSLAGITFSLYNTADIANVLYGHLKLPVPEVGEKGKQHPSTDKHCLDLLRDEHPIIPVIKEHRTLAKLLNCTLGSICSVARLSVKTQRYTIHGHWLQTSTATGRLSMEEPNLQCVEHLVEFKMNKEKNGGDAGAEYHKINARDYIIPTQENWVLLTADYSQIELRLMAHFSEDSALIDLLSKPLGDVFTMITARWTGKAEDSVSSQEREQTKRMVYGILYGMGAKSLAEQLNCSPDEAMDKIQSFKSCFPCVDSWLRGAVSCCRQKGYIETLKGRKRFLSKIKFGNFKEKSKAQRQAVNSICQGSAADIIKIAMINIHAVAVEGNVESDCNPLLVEKFRMLKGRCRILLQVHDELVLEVDPEVIKEVAQLLQMSMENAASLRVPLQVKLKIGKTWGSLEPYDAKYYEDAVLMPNS
ncbi:hypothetical protein CDL15_Pgr015673 [Punica granatum]|uniref:Helicase and polymerase-containing protein TEBICHI n=1 Tax=Punica granatum TaxID=22663 RepID=A0A218XPC6_PUNGR|nr:hypothetical protein CDL15_Pgr015673 [Punica granatum]